MQNSNYMQPMIDLPWSPEEHSLFLQGYLVYGKSWIEIAEVVRSRNAYQVCNYAQWLESHGILPRLPPVQYAAAPQMQTSPMQQAQGQSTPTYNKGSWSKEEHDLFLTALKTHGKSWKAIAQVVTTRNATQIQTHARTYFKSIGEPFGSAKKRKATDGETPTPKKKQAAASKKILSPPRKVSKLPTSTGSAFKPVASTPKRKQKSKSKDDSIVDVKPPSMKAATKSAKKVVETTMKQAAIDSTDSTPQITTDQEDALVAKMKMPMIEAGIVATILLVGGAIVYYMGAKEGEL